MATRFTEHTIVAALFALPGWQRARTIDQIISHLDALDLATEDMEDDDPAGDPLDIDGEAPTDDGNPMLDDRPVYADDQSTGPINELAALHDWHDRANGLRS